MQQLSPWLQLLSPSPITKTWHNQMNKYFKKFNYVWEHTASYLTYGKHTYPTFVITLFSTWFFKMGVLLFVKWEVLCLKGCVSYFCFHIPSPCEHLPVMCAAFPFTHCILWWAMQVFPKKWKSYILLLPWQHQQFLAFLKSQNWAYHNQTRNSFWKNNHKAATCPHSFFTKKKKKKNLEQKGMI